jgi:hypothetical protein
MIQSYGEATLEHAFPRQRLTLVERWLADPDRSNLVPAKKGKGSPPDTACKPAESHLQAGSPSAAQATGANQGRPGLEDANKLASRPRGISVGTPVLAEKCHPFR